LKRQNYFWKNVGAIIDRPQATAKPKRATNGRPYSVTDCKVSIYLENIDKLKNK
jgi:hypothetical protein